MQDRKLYFGFLPAAVSNKECADTAMAMTLICLLAVMYTRSLALLPLALALLLLGMVWPRVYSPLAKLWLGLSLLLGSVMSRLVLSIIFWWLQRQLPWSCACSVMIPCGARRGKRGQIRPLFRVITFLKQKTWNILFRLCSVGDSAWIFSKTCCSFLCSAKNSGCFPLSSYCCCLACLL